MNGCEKNGTGSVAISTGGGGIWLTFLYFSLLGYALFGRWFAYTGVPPVFIGEVLLFCGVVSVVLFARWDGPFETPAIWFLLLLLAWGLWRMWLDFPRYRADALRDAVIWGYSVFALVVCGSLLGRPKRLAILLQRYRQFTLLFPMCVPVVWIISQFFSEAVPRWPWIEVPVLFAKGGDILVHLSGILAFWVAGLGGAISNWRLLLLAACVGLVGTFDRAGLLAFLGVFALCLVLKPHDRLLWRLTALGLCGLALFAATGLRVQMPGREREISFTQFVANLASIGGDTRAGDLDETKEWRLEWWSDIVGYTVQGQYFWSGKGFGINLADDDDYQVDENGSLRSPHNGHLTMLARGGVPGLVLWALVHLSWACALARGYFRSRRAGDDYWAGLFLFLLAYGMAFMINTTFDVFLEGPMGGIWYWTLYGVGLAALWFYWRHPRAVPWSLIGGATMERVAPLNGYLRAGAIAPVGKSL